MPVKYKHDDSYSMYFCTFTCFNWLSLIEITKSYDQVYNWFNILKQEKASVVAFVIMPNHLHCILHFPDAGFDLNKIIGNAKRFMAYEIINRLKENKQTALLEVLAAAVTERERKKGQLHKVFKDSFDAKAIFSDKFLMQKMDYIHHNPISGKWNLAKDFVSYEHSSASFYELGMPQHFLPVHYRNL
jgi:REP element-mobilizing transposase RayT